MNDASLALIKIRCCREKNEVIIFIEILSVCSLYESVSALFVYFVLSIPHVREIIWYLFFSVYLISLSIYPQDPSMLPQMDRFHSFL